MKQIILISILTFFLIGAGIVVKVTQVLTYLINGKEEDVKALAAKGNKPEEMNDWENEHPFDAYAAIKSYKPGQPGVEPPTLSNTQKDLQGTAQPGAPGGAAPGIAEGQTATNPANGARMIYRNGKWGPM